MQVKNSGGTATDIAGILRQNAINSSNVEDWLYLIDR